MLTSSEAESAERARRRRRRVPASGAESPASLAFASFCLEGSVFSSAAWTSSEAFLRRPLVPRLRRRGSDPSCSSGERSEPSPASRSPFFSAFCSGSDFAEARFLVREGDDAGSDGSSADLRLRTRTLLTSGSWKSRAVIPIGGVSPGTESSGDENCGGDPAERAAAPESEAPSAMISSDSTTSLEGALLRGLRLGSSSASDWATALVASAVDSTSACSESEALRRVRAAGRRTRAERTAFPPFSPCPS